MGYTVLYIAFGIVALWLLGEVLLQYKAQLQWRILAFVGFVTVVLGVSSRNVILIAVGTMAFALGQTFVTLAYRSGFSEGWTLRAPGGEGGGSVLAAVGKRGGRAGADGGPRSNPTLRVSEVEPMPGVRAEATGYAQAPVPAYQPQEIHDDSGEYAAYGGWPRPGSRLSEEDRQEPVFGGSDPYTDPYGTGGQEPVGANGYATNGYGADDYATNGYGTTDGYGSNGYGYPDGDQQAGGTPGFQNTGFQNTSYPDNGFQDTGGLQQPAYQDQTAAMPMFPDGVHPDQTAAMPVYQDTGRRATAYQGDYPRDEQDSGLGRGAYLPPEREQYTQPQAAYLDPGQYQPQAEQPPEPQHQFSQDPYAGQYQDQPGAYPDQPAYPDQQGYQDQGYQDPAGYPQQPYPDVYGDPYGTPPGGVWVPQQQTGEYPPPPPVDQPGGHDPYRY